MNVYRDLNIECDRTLLAIPQNTGYIGKLHFYELLNSAAITMMIYEQETSSMLTIINFTERWNAHGIRMIMHLTIINRAAMFLRGCHFIASLVRLVTTGFDKVEGAKIRLQPRYLKERRVRGRARLPREPELFQKRKSRLFPYSNLVSHRRVSPNIRYACV